MTNFLMRFPLLLSAAALLLHADINFNGTHSYNVPSSAIALDDFNGDNNPDVISGGRNLYLLAGRGNGRFQQPVPIAAGPGGAGAFATSILTGDFNHDGNRDVVAVFYTSPATIMVLLGNGDGTFRPPVSLTAGGFPVGAIAADLDADNIADLAIATISGSTGSISLLKGQANGTFVVAGQISTGTSVPLSLVVGDFNGDSTSDLVVGTLESSGKAVQIYTLLNDGTATFHLGGSFTFSNSSRIFGMATADFNGDHKLDLVFETNLFDTTQTNILIGMGNGSFQNGGAFVVAGASGGIAIADLNQDGKADFIQGGAVFLGKGDGTFTQSPESGILGVVVAGDINHDSKPDVISGAVPTTEETVNAYLKVSIGNGDGTFDTSPNLGGGGGQSVIAADFNRDGKQDAALGGGGGQQFVIAADFNQDGKQDAAFSITVDPIFDEGYVFVQSGNGDGTLQSGVSLPNFGGPGTWVMATGDLNLDGKPDIVAAVLGGGNGVDVYLGNGDGSFRASTYPTVSEVTAIVIQDMNRDGIPDLVLVTAAQSNTTTPEVAIMYGAGGGVFGAPVYSPSALSPFNIAVGDFNGDHQPDLAILNAESRTTPASISLLLSRPDGTFQAASIPLGTALTVGTIAACDLNGDSFTDLAVSFSGTNISGVATFLSAGDGTFRFSAYYTDYRVNTRGADPVVLNFADMDGDGVPDMVTLRPSGEVSVLKGVGDGTFAPSVELFGPRNQVGGNFAVADFNGDRKLDFVMGPNVVLLNTSE